MFTVFYITTYAIDAKNMSTVCVDSAKLIADAARVQCDSKGGHDTWKKVYKYKGYTVSWMQSPENLEALQTFEVKDDDIFCVTYPKAGEIN